MESAWPGVRPTLDSEQRGSHGGATAGAGRGRIGGQLDELPHRGGACRNSGTMGSAAARSCVSATNR